MFLSTEMSIPFINSCQRAQNTKEVLLSKNLKNVETVLWGEKTGQVNLSTKLREGYIRIKIYSHIHKKFSLPSWMCLLELVKSTSPICLSSVTRFWH